MAQILSLVGAAIVLAAFTLMKLKRYLVKQGMTRLQAKERTEKAAATVWDRTKQP
jgi:hypothetical protein